MIALREPRARRLREIGLAAHLERDLLSWLERVTGEQGENLVSVVLFGSCVSGRAHKDSDLDTLIIARDLDQSRLRRRRPFLRAAREISPALAEKISIVALTPKQAEHVRPFYLGMLDASCFLRDDGDFFAGVLGRLRARLAELGSRKLVDPDGYEYWDLKPDYKRGDVIVL